MHSPPPSAGLRSALERESERIVHSPAIRSALERLLFFEPPVVYPPLRQDARPDVTLVIENNYALSKRLPAALDALSVIMAHSARLTKLPTLKVAFWRAVLGSTALREDACVDSSEYVWAVADECLPVLCIDLRRTKSLTRSSLDALFAFFTTPPARSMDEPILAQCVRPRDPDSIRVDLRLDYSNATPSNLQQIEAMLDRVFASPTRQFAVKTLGLGWKAMRAAHLEVVASIVRKCHAVYRIENVVLNHVLSSSGADDDDAEGRADVLGLLPVYAAACNSSLVLRATGLPVMPSHLKILNVASNRAGLAHVAALCSALRYGSQLEEIFLDDVIDCSNESDRAQCWRWIASALFYPRSKKLARGRKLRSISIEMPSEGSGESEAFVKTLSDPVGGLVYHGARSSAGRQASAHTELLLCTVKRGATFFVAASDASEVVHTLTRKRELEALCHEVSGPSDNDSADGDSGGTGRDTHDWTCVVLPGIGLGWVRSGEILSIEREAIDELHHRAIDVEWTMQFLPRTADVVNYVLAAVGRYLSFMDFDHYTDIAVALPATLRHCVNLQHLSLCFDNLTDSSFDTLLDALDGELGDRLLSLDLCNNYMFGRRFERMMAFLTDRPRTPALEELRMSAQRLEDSDYASLAHMLDVNKRLRHVHLTQEPYDQIGCQLLRKRFNQELLSAALPMREKLAFLSVLQHPPCLKQEQQQQRRRSDTPGSARHGLDSFMVAIIFAFAAVDVRRWVF